MPLRPDDALGAHVAAILDSHYEVDSEIGRGGMGIVYCAKDKRLKRNVAIKLLPPELAFRTDIRSRFLREAETAAQLRARSSLAKCAGYSGRWRTRSHSRISETSFTVTSSRTISCSMRTPAARWSPISESRVLSRIQVIHG